jgi:hypothetical protein
VEAVDIDGDGFMDIICRFDSRITISFGDGGKTWDDRNYSIPSHEGMDVGDISGDGKPDVVGNGFYLKNPGSRAGSWQQITIDAYWFSGQDGEGINNSSRVECADMNGDGVVDPVISHSEKPSQPIKWYSSPDGGVSWQPHLIAASVSYCHSLQMGDIDHDGDPDILGANLNHNIPEGGPAIFVYLNDGDSESFTHMQVAPVSSYIAVLVDVDQDNDLDVWTSRHYDQAPMELYVNNLDPKP